MTNNEFKLLRLIVAEWTRVRTLPYWTSLERKELEAGFGVHVSGQWLGQDAAARQSRRRGLAELERLGLIALRARWGRKVTHAEPTPEGIALAGDFSRSPCAMTPEQIERMEAEHDVAGDTAEVGG